MPRRSVVRSLSPANDLKNIRKVIRPHRNPRDIGHAQPTETAADPGQVVFGPCHHHPLRRVFADMGGVDGEVVGETADQSSIIRQTCQHRLQVEDRGAVESFEAADPVAQAAGDLEDRDSVEADRVGRSGERVLKTPVSGLRSSSRGRTESTERSARSSQVRRMTSAPARRYTSLRYHAFNALKSSAPQALSSPPLH